MIPKPLAWGWAFIQIALCLVKRILKAVYTIGNCQRLAFTVCIAQHA